MFSSLLLAGALLSFAATSHAAEAFNPRHYPKKVATCKALNRELQKEVDIKLYYVDINPHAEKTIVMVHGWPSLWSSWKNQIQELQGDHRLIVPDLRGFGSSTHPGDVRTSGTIPDNVGDIACILQHAQVERAVWFGHDWGSQVCFEAARSRPELVEALVDITVPYIPSDGPFTPTAALVAVLPKLAYQVFFDENTSAAVAELSKDIRRTLRATLRTVNSPPPDGFLLSNTSYLDGWKHVAEIPPIPFFTRDEEDYWVEQYSIQKFAHTLYFYTTPNRQASWQFVHDQGNFTIAQPVLSILPTEDPVADWVEAMKILGSEKHLTHLTVETFHGAHWVHLEHPKPVNAAIRKWLNGLPAEAASARDEL